MDDQEQLNMALDANETVIESQFSVKDSNITPELSGTTASEGYDSDLDKKNFFNCEDSHNVINNIRKLIDQEIEHVITTIFDLHLNKHTGIEKEVKKFTKNVKFKITL